MPVVRFELIVSALPEVCTRVRTNSQAARRESMCQFAGSQCQRRRGLSEWPENASFKGSSDMDEKPDEGVGAI